MAQRTQALTVRMMQPVLETRDLPDGICGIMRGVAVVYNAEDAYGTRFAPGCLERTKREKVKAKKVSLFVDHIYGTRTHVGTVTSLITQGDQEMMTAEVFDTEDGRRAKEYLEAVVKSGGYTGLSVGFYDRTEPPTGKPDPIYTYTECELEEVSITPRPAVPGADVLGVRRDDTAAAWRLFEAALAVLPLESIRARIDALAKGHEPEPDTQKAGHTPDPDADAGDGHSPTEAEEAAATWAVRRRAMATLALEM